MDKTLTATYDGQVFRPDAPLDLAPNSRYVITLHLAQPAAAEGNVGDLLEELAGTVDAPEDWAGEHDRYLYGSPKLPV